MTARPLLLLLLLAGCGRAAPGGNRTEEATIPAPDPTQTAEADGRIECAVGGGGFARACTVERNEDGDGLVLIVRAPSGGFRRLRVTGDGRGVIAADGAEPARVTVLGPGRIEVAIGGDRYRLPATVRQ